MSLLVNIAEFVSSQDKTGELTMPRQIKRVVKNRVLLTLLAVTTVWFSLTALLVPKANACPNFIRFCYYYTDETHTVQCGYREWPCCGGVIYHEGCNSYEFEECDARECPN
jgi:hypothetical protein